MWASPPFFLSSLKSHSLCVSAHLLHQHLPVHTSSAQATSQQLFSPTFKRPRDFKWFNQSVVIIGARPLITHVAQSLLVGCEREGSSRASEGKSWADAVKDATLTERHWNCSAVFTWTNLLVVVVELCGSEQEALDLVPLVTNVVLEEHYLIVGVVVVVDPGVIPINSRGEKQRMHLRDSFLADQLDPIYVAYNM